MFLHLKHSHEKNSTIDKKALWCHKLALFLNFTNHYTQQACGFLHFTSTKLRVLFPQASRPHCHSNVLSHYSPKKSTVLFPFIQQLHPPCISNLFCLRTNNLFSDTTGSDDLEIMSHRIVFIGGPSAKPFMLLCKWNYKLFFKKKNILFMQIKEPNVNPCN